LLFFAFALLVALVLGRASALGLRLLLRLLLAAAASAAFLLLLLFAALFFGRLFFLVVCHGSARGDGRAALADASLLAVFALVPNARRLAALGIDRHHVGRVNRRLFADLTALLIARRRALVARHHVEPFDD